MKQKVLLPLVISVLVVPAVYAQPSVSADSEQSVLSESGITVADNSRLANPRRKTAKDKRSLSQRIADKLEKDRRRRETKKLIREQEKQRKQQREASAPETGS
ncbi:MULTISPECIES: hypothetical protein [unclassified Neisseria]|uniref:hypothetical protein n=1 Tax=unclassified Neisseria TaxID=2623750 RepID=UPI00266672E8|nr:MULTISPECIES: hypothetical protein [unclassified Neisseria]MDO1508915.1 hypothetical protein [Neisseria sp. MVDL19-042950]MDO1515174.1 hypothetical protein [Neisseria sp. MVDL18-041461]MDO1562534.1 hypothetical protein [Neisseria sp. MVDL20-010259]